MSVISCIKSPPIKIPRDKFDILREKQNQSYPIDLGDSRCTYGGILLITWTDQEVIDGIYTEGIDNDYNEKAVCFAIPSGNNTATVTKPGDFKIIATDIAVGDKDCPQGGKRYESFIDVDGSSTYDSKVDTNYNSKKICNGLNGTASLSGGNGVIITTTLATGNSQCPTGGTKLESFTDLNANGTYEAEIDTFYSTKYTCHEQKALVLYTNLSLGDSNCPVGGTLITTCIDSNGDATCTSGPDLNYTTQKICNGAGAGFLVVVENPGSNCKAGGYKLDRFQDNNNNAVYDIGPDTGYTSTYICNGLNWLSRSTSFTAGNGTAGDNTACSSGGTRFEFGYDHVNSSNGAYFVGTDGVLDAAEIVASSTVYSCIGNSTSNSAAGPLISKFQNDSEGTKARFYWEIITSDGAAPNVKLAYSSTKAGIQSWNCESSLAGVTVVTNFSSCTDTTYRTAASGILTSNAQCGFDLTAAPFSTAAWDYRYFKLCAQNSTTPNSQSITTFRVAGNVPAGMVMVHLDDWPIHEFANTNITPFTYAIDKWEPYLSGGAITNGTPGVCTSTNCISSSTGVLTSATAQTPPANMDWYANRKGCANRTAPGYTGANTLRTIHLQTEMENFVANYGTPDGQDATIAGVGGGNPIIISGYLACNTDLAHDYSNGSFSGNGFDVFQTGDQATKNCISRYGARDLIGNYFELFDGYYEDLCDPNLRQKSVYWGTADKVTTVISDAILGYVLPTALNLSVSDWDYQNLLPKPPYAALTAPSQKFFSDQFNILCDVPPIIPMQTEYGSRAGRFEKNLSNFTLNQATARCAIVSP